MHSCLCYISCPIPNSLSGQGQTECILVLATYLVLFLIVLVVRDRRSVHIPGLATHLVLFILACDRRNILMS